METIRHNEIYLKKKKKIASGAFREISKATTIKNGIPEIYAFKKFIETSIKLIKDTLNTEVEDHTQKASVNAHWGKEYHLAI